MQLSLVGHVAGYFTMFSRWFHHVLEFGIVLTNTGRIRILHMGACMVFRWIWIKHFSFLWIILAYMFNSSASFLFFFPLHFRHFFHFLFLSDLDPISQSILQFFHQICLVTLGATLKQKSWLCNFLNNEQLCATKRNSFLLHRKGLRILVWQSWVSRESARENLWVMVGFRWGDCPGGCPDTNHLSLTATTVTSHTTS